MDIFIGVILGVAMVIGALYWFAKKVDKDGKLK